MTVPHAILYQVACTTTAQQALWVPDGWEMELEIITASNGTAAEVQVYCYITQDTPEGGTPDATDLVLLPGMKVPAYDAVEWYRAEKARHVCRAHERMWFQASSNSAIVVRWHGTARQVVA